MADLLNRPSPHDSDAGLPVLSVDFSARESRCVLTMNGQLSHTSIVALEVQIDQIGCSEYEALVLEVAGLRAIDAVALQVLIGLATYVRALGVQLRVNGACGEVAEMLEAVPQLRAALEAHCDTRGHFT